MPMELQVENGVELLYPALPWSLEHEFIETPNTITLVSLPHSSKKIFKLLFHDVYKIFIRKIHIKKIRSNWNLIFK